MNTLAIFIAALFGQYVWILLGLAHSLFDAKDYFKTKKMFLFSVTPLLPTLVVPFYVLFYWIPVRGVALWKSLD
jgi:hypothetical protein